MDAPTINDCCRETMIHLHQVNADAHAMWLEAHEVIEKTEKRRKGLQLQIEALGQRDGFRLRYRDKMLAQILGAAIGWTHADMGNIQLVDPQCRRLVIRVQQGFQAPFVDFFNGVRRGQAAYRKAAKTGERTIIDDTSNSPGFADNLSLEVILEAKARALQSTPLVAQSGQTVGMLSTHYQTLRRPSARDLHTIDHYAKLAVALLEWYNHGNQLLPGKPARGARVTNRCVRDARAKTFDSAAN